MSALVWQNAIMILTCMLSRLANNINSCSRVVKSKPPHTCAVVLSVLFQCIQKNPAATKLYFVFRSCSSFFQTCVLSSFPSTHPSVHTPCGFWLILPQLEQQVFAGRNGDTWMHPVRILITQCADCAPPLLNNLEKCACTVNTSAAHAQAHMAAGGHL